MLRDLAQFWTADACEGLAGRTAYQHIDCACDTPKFEIRSQLRRRDICDVARTTVLWIRSVEIPAVRSRGELVVLNRGGNTETCSLEAKRKAAAPSKQIKQPWLASFGESFDSGAETPIHRATP